MVSHKLLKITVAILLVTALFFTSYKENITTNKPDIDSSCKPYNISGAHENKADLVLVGKNYDSRKVMKEDFKYYLDFNSDNRGLFGIYPFNVSKHKFNIWTLYTGHSIVDSDEGNMIESSEEQFEKCPQGDYYAVLSKDYMGRFAFAKGDALWVSEIHRKKKEDKGARGLNHEFGHAFAGLKDEYYSEDGDDRHGKPNCAPTLDKAEEWWGDMAENNSKVGFYRGCSYTKNNWRPHSKSIMGNGGLWHYGPVNNRKLLEELSNYK